MRIIVSPAKKMKSDTGEFAVEKLPVLLDDTKKILNRLNELSYDELKSVWKCNEKLALLNEERVRTMDLEKRLIPAVMSYEGLAFQHMSPTVFTEEAIEYIKEHLRILSGFYGILSPFDGVTPYRLEMQAQLSVDGSKDLYDFWKDKLYNELMDDTKIVLNLASGEYSKAIEKYLKPEDRFISVIFGELKDGKVKQKGTFAKMARGEMVRFLAENNITDIEGVKDFSEMDFKYSEEYSNENKLVFTL